MSSVAHKFYLVDYIIQQQGSPYVYKTRMTFRLVCYLDDFMDSYNTHGSWVVLSACYCDRAMCRKHEKS